MQTRTDRSTNKLTTKVVDVIINAHILYGFVQHIFQMSRQFSGI